MLIENVNGERRASSLLKNSDFYIEVAKFVQAYTTIVQNPNEFLKEIGANPIDEKTDKLSWDMFVDIVQKCDLGFTTTPTSEELVVYYNYALEMGTINPKHKRLASVDDVADAQKHYYNFVDDSRAKAEEEYLKQRRTTDLREKEAMNADNELSKVKTYNLISLACMMIACLVGTYGVATMIFNGAIIRGLICIVIAVVGFIYADRFFIKTQREYLKLKQATAVIFTRSDENFAIEQNLKRKLEAIQKDYLTVQEELADKTKKHDVKHNIESLKASNKFYKKLCEHDESYVLENYVEQREQTDDQQALAPVKLVKLQSEDVRETAKEAITLEGKFDVDAYNEKFEKPSKKSKKSMEERLQDEKDAIKKEEEQQKIQKVEIEKVREQEKKKKEEELLNSMDYINAVLNIDDPSNSMQK